MTLKEIRSRGVQRHRSTERDSYLEQCTKNLDIKQSNEEDRFYDKLLNWGIKRNFWKEILQRERGRSAKKKTVDLSAFSKESVLFIFLLGRFGQFKGVHCF